MPEIALAGGLGCAGESLPEKTLLPNLFFME